MKHTPNSREVVYSFRMGRTNIEIDENLVRKARKLTRLKTKREIVDAALELLVRSESRKGILQHFGTGLWKGDLKAMRRNRGGSWWIVRCGSIFSVVRQDAPEM